MKDTWLRIATYQSDVVIVKGMVIPKRNILVSNMPNVVKKDIWLKIVIVKRLIG